MYGIVASNKRRPYRKLEDGEMKTQSSVEYISTFAAAALIIVIVIAVVGLLFFNSNTPASTETSSSCYISPEIKCEQFLVATNGMASEAIVLFTNNLGQTIQFGANSFAVSPTYAQKSFIGECFPSNAMQNVQVICSATLSGYRPSLGTQLTPSFQITYTECQINNCAVPLATYKTLGSATTYVSSMISGCGSGTIFAVSGSSQTTTINTNNQDQVAISGSSDNIAVNIAPGISCTMLGSSCTIPISISGSSGTIVITVGNTNCLITLDLSGSSNDIHVIGGSMSLVISGSSNDIYYHGTAITSQTDSGSGNNVISD